MSVRRRVFMGAAVAITITFLQVATAQVAAAATPTFVQARANEVNSGTTNSRAFTSATTAGNSIVIAVLWNNAGAVSVADNRGNTYTSARRARTTWGTNWSSQAFYATNIAGGANTVTATFATPINDWGIIYIHEYSGLGKVNPVDVTNVGDRDCAAP